LFLLLIFIGMASSYHISDWCGSWHSASRAPGYTMYVINKLPCTCISLVMARYITSHRILRYWRCIASYAYHDNSLSIKSIYSALL